MFSSERFDNNKNERRARDDNLDRVVDYCIFRDILHVRLESRDFRADVSGI